MLREIVKQLELCGHKDEHGHELELNTAFINLKRLAAEKDAKEQGEKLNKKTLMAAKQFLELQEGWDLEELKEEMVTETKLLQHGKVGEDTLATDECGVTWDNEDICGLSDFIDAYTDIFIEKICNVLESFMEEDMAGGEAP